MTSLQHAPTGHDRVLRLRVAIRGAVQGVGFRPFIYRLATTLGLPGWVNNSSQGVFVEVEGPREALEAFLLRIEREKPPRSFIQSMEPSFLDPIGFTEFEIRPSDASGEKSALILPDIATCPDCRREIFDPANRRYRYPFTNCTNCGPRFTIIEALPYDRPNTTMRAFAMCEHCRAEYEDPLDRRFHAQPNACPACGPHLQAWDGTGTVLATQDEALRAAVEAIRRGAIVAVKGLGGFHLMVDACCEEAVAELRRRKHREEKPLALMAPSVAAVRQICDVSALEERLLCSAESPIVLLRRRSNAAEIAPSIAPRNPYLGVMLPYTPLHHLLMAELAAPIVATSGNLSDEPICTDERDAFERLGGIADLFLVHNRPIARHVDDSLVRVLIGRELVLRRARGYAPLPIGLKESVPPTLAVGAHLKNSIALAAGHQVFVSQHIGDLETAPAHDAFRRVIADFEHLYDVHPLAVAHDAHPDYLSTAYARQQGLPLVSVQHHVAHVLSVMAENELDGPVLGVSWDGTGYGLDGTVWGGEFFRIAGGSAVRVAHLRTFGLPGGEKAVKEPWRTATGLLYELHGDELFAREGVLHTLLHALLQTCSVRERAIVQAMLARGINTPRTSSAGRLFDGVAALAGLRATTAFEGQAAMELEFALDGTVTDERYDIDVVPAAHAVGGTAGDAGGTMLIVDWAPLLYGVLHDLREQVPTARIAARFHNALAEAIVCVARQVGEERVVLTGGCFQNAYLTERTVSRLNSAGFCTYWHQRIPPNDGGIALGQVIAAAGSIGVKGG